jgi:uncharacterized protein (TIGR00369 family)
MDMDAATDTAAPPTIDLARRTLAAQPFSVLLGTRLAQFGLDGVTLELDVRDELRQQHGYVHGGVVSYLVDNAITFAAGAVLGPDVVTGGFTVDYLRPTTGGLLQARATVVRAGARQVVLCCTVHDTDLDDPGSLCAIGQGRANLRRPSRSPTQQP